ncbi:TadE/TadG family type IV pilus assembly protein [Blautia sp. MSJ-19]|uniref:TadE/TadG family type IV pilus assembly protein n=1 Tax=Blautia sp. MSJ-19 TaxID=2841517 RepID=UPI001C0EB1D5|nr:TadE family protein [Blautia sp. MSJ-19]MBU5482448.1 pilus assembly protein [Blautia sp. MSJ-19]
MKTRQKSRRKGSFTIEAACVMAIILVTVMGVLYLSFFVHNRAWLTAAACEASLAGSMEGVRKNGQTYATAFARGQELGNVGFFGAENLQCQVKAGKEVHVTYQADTIVAYGGFQWPLRAEGSAKIICPAEWIRKAKAASEIIIETED